MNKDIGGHQEKNCDAAKNWHPQVVLKYFETDGWVLLVEPTDHWILTGCVFCPMCGIRLGPKPDWADRAASVAYAEMGESKLRWIGTRRLAEIFREAKP